MYKLKTMDLCSNTSSISRIGTGLGTLHTFRSELLKEIYRLLSVGSVDCASYVCLSTPATTDVIESVGLTVESEPRCELIGGLCGWGSSAIK